MSLTRFFIVPILILTFQGIYAQSGFYHTDSVRQIKLYFYVSDWDSVLDSLYIEGLENRALADVEIDGVYYDSVGVRYKGYSSVSVNRIKNPFNIKLDYVINDQNHRGFNKIKLSNVIQDPSFLREVLSYEIARKYMPAPESNYANLFINDTLWGVYTNVEAVNKDFLAKHYASRNNTFFKCNPDQLDLNGENSNLGNAPGTDSSSYSPYYSIKSDFGWSDLYTLIDTLNNFSSSIESVLNVDRALWMHAFNYSLVNFDSYVGYAQNYYLYKDVAGRFNPIMWDLNMSFASFRFTDASLFYDGFTIAESSTLDPLTHLNNISVYPRPLLRKLLENDSYKRMYIAHLRTIMEENFTNQEYATRGLELQNMLDVHVQSDTNKFYTYNDFIDNLNTTVSDLIDYPGITQLMDDRVVFLADYPGVLGAPTITTPAYSPQNFNLGDSLWITSSVTDASSITLAYRFGSNEVFKYLEMLDDGMHQDEDPNDLIYGAAIPNTGNNIQYYIYAENDSAGRFSPERAAYEYHSIQSQLINSELVINEIMANNQSVVADQDGEFDDWIELYNTSSYDVSTGGLHLSDDYLNLIKWPIPNLVIPPDNYLIIWADSDSEQDGLHANFKLSSGGEGLYLSYDGTAILDDLIFFNQTIDLAYGRSPNGTGNFTELSPTFNGNNDLSTISVAETPIEFSCFPNPANQILTIEYSISDPAVVELRSVAGHLIKTISLNEAKNTIDLDINDLNNGIYFISLRSDKTLKIKKIIKL